MKEHMLQVHVSDYQEFKQVRQGVLTILRTLLQTQHSAMEVALHEAVNNAFHHGSNPEHPMVTIKMDVICGKRLIIRVQDNGKGFTASDYVQGVKADYEAILDEKVLAESGRGISMMKLLSDYICYNHQGNEVLLMKKIH